MGTKYECGSWSNEKYPVIDLFGEKYVPLFANNDDIWDASVDKLAKLILDSNESYTLEAGEILDLGHGYALEVRQIDIDCENVWLEFTRDGQYLADQTISVSDENDKAWTVALDNVQGEDNIVVMKVHVNQLFVGVEKRIVRIDGIWLIDYANARGLKIGDEFGEFTLEEIISGVDESNSGSLVFKKNPLADNIRDVVGTNYECDCWSNEQYPVLDLFGEESVPLLANNDDIRDAHINKLAGLVLDSNETYTLEKGEKLDLGRGYALEVRQITDNIDGGKVWLEFSRDGQHVADRNISVDSENNKTWTVALDNVQGENDIVVMKVHVRQVFVGMEKRIVWINGIWLIDYANARTLNIGDKFGELTLEEIICGVDESDPGSLVFENVSVSDFSSSVAPGKEPDKSTDKSTGSFTSWCRDLWNCIIMKSK
ncbi:MAG: S-layer protein domain-containing protein [Methanosarcinaceae archaeon]